MGKIRWPLRARGLDECGYRLPPTYNIAPIPPKSQAHLQMKNEK